MLCRLQNYYQYYPTMVQKTETKWKRKFQGAKSFGNVKNPLRNFIEQELKAMDLSQYIDRPSVKIDLSIGDPTKSQQFRTHPSNLQIINKNVGKVDGYTNFQGLDQARQQIVKLYQTPNYKITKENVFLTAGGSMAIWYTAALLCNPGDNLLFPSPGFPLLLLIAKTMGVTTKFYTLNPYKKWQCNLQQLQSLIDNRTKLIYVVDPSNPLGSCWSQEHKKGIIEVATRRKIPILADEIYEQVSDDPSIKNFADLANKQTVIFKISGLTKKWFGPGWRLGWLVVFGQENMISACLNGLKRLTNVFLMPNTILQSSLKDILQNPQNKTHLLTRTAIMKRTQQLCFTDLKDQSYCSVSQSSGALYLAIVMNIEKFKNNQISTCKQFCKKIYGEENVMIFPGQFFNGKINFIRLVIACSTTNVEEFLVRFKRFSRKYLA